MDEEITVIARRLRGDIKEIEDVVRALMENSVFEGEQAFPYQHSEMKANIILAVQHLEDARMRLGKLCQYVE